MKKPNTDELLIDLVSRKMRGDVYSLHDLISKVKWDYPDVYEAYTSLVKAMEQDMNRDNKHLSVSTGALKDFRINDKGRKEILIKIIKDNSTITDLPHDL